MNQDPAPGDSCILFVDLGGSVEISWLISCSFLGSSLSLSHCLEVASYRIRWDFSLVKQGMELN